MNIRLSNLHLSYGQRHVLDGVSLGPLERGTVTGLLGPNGAGKSTLIKAIAGLKTPTSGEVIISDDDGHVSGAQLRDVVGYLPQDVLATASLTVLESVLTSARSRSKATVERAAHVLERVGIAHIAHRFISQLSGGQRQLVALAQMVVRDPQVLLLDEPTSALDLHNQIEVLRLVRRAVDSGHRMAIVALHDLNLAARYADALIAVKDGGIFRHGPPAEVLTDISKIPEPVRRMRELIVEAAASGDVERLRSILGKGETATQIGDGSEEDPVAAIKALSGDPDGLEILAIMLDLLSTGFVRLEPGTPDEMYVWPYFVARPLDQLSPPEKVDLLRLMTAGDFANMQEFGSYNFYRIGISPDGQWKFLAGGD